MCKREYNREPESQTRYRISESVGRSVGLICVEKITGRLEDRQGSKRNKQDDSRSTKSFWFYLCIEDGRDDLC